MLSEKDKALIIHALGESAVPFMADFGHATSVRLIASDLVAIINAARHQAQEEAKAVSVEDIRQQALVHGFSEPIHIDHADFLGKVLAGLFMRQPCMSGDQRDRLNPKERRAVDAEAACIIKALDRAIVIAAAPNPPRDERIAELEAALAKLPPRPWSVWTSCSYRRIGGATGGDGDVLSGIIQRSDGHPDLSMTEEKLQALVDIVHAADALAALNTKDKEGAE